MRVTRKQIIRLTEQRSEHWSNLSHVNKEKDHERAHVSTPIVMFAVVLGACAKATSQPADEMINPGDKVGNFLITTGKEGDVIYGWELDKCVHQDDSKIYWCPTIEGIQVNVSIRLHLLFAIP